MVSGIEFSCAPYKLCESAECAFWQVYFVIGTFCPNDPEISAGDRSISKNRSAKFPNVGINLRILCGLAEATLEVTKALK